jgi:hypothetical protein
MSWPYDDGIDALYGPAIAYGRSKGGPGTPKNDQHFEEFSCKSVLICYYSNPDGNG